VPCENQLVLVANQWVILTSTICGKFGVEQLILTKKLNKLNFIPTMLLLNNLKKDLEANVR
jgi:hypothetical protein